jgi:spore germination cell wall hydrolase CwlJ-like protein
MVTVHIKVVKCNSAKKISVKIVRRRRRFRPKSGKQILKNLKEGMHIVARKKNTNDEKEAICAVKSQHANYKWIKHMFAHQDKLEERIKNLEKTVTFLKDEIEKLREEKLDAKKE